MRIIEAVKPSNWLTFVTSFLALTAFAANSVLCRLAMGDSSIDPAGFTGIRMLSGAITLAFIVALFTRSNSNNSSENLDKPRNNNLSLHRIFSRSNNRGWLGSAMLFGYAAFFSFAYVKLTTASGALILFATVQFTMIGVSIFKGHNLQFKEWLGVVISFVGFVLLMLPSATQPSLIGFILMVVAGIFWAFYTLLGRGAKAPVSLTADNFIRCVPLALIFLLFSLSMYELNWQGVWYAVASGAIASGVGYSVWYLALRNLSITQAAISQLSVPLIAAVGGIVFINESLTTELVVSGVLILAGILFVSLKKKN